MPFIWTRPGGNCLVLQWLGVCASTARGMDSRPGWGTKISHGVAKKKKKWGFPGGSLAKIGLPTQKTRVQFLVWEDPTCLRATKPMHSYESRNAIQPLLCNKGSHCNKKPALQLEGGPAHCSQRKPGYQQRTSTAKNT